MRVTEFGTLAKTREYSVLIYSHPGNLHMPFVSSRFISLILLCVFIHSGAFAEIVLIDDFSWPGTATHGSLVGESRAAFPPGTSGGSILPLTGGSDIAKDRGLFGATNSLLAGADHLAISLAAVDFAEIDWDVHGFNFHANDTPWVMMTGLSNLGSERVDLTLELFQTSDGVNGNVGTGEIDVSLAAGATTNITFSTVAWETDFVGFRIINNSSTSFTGRISSFSAVPEPSSVLPLLLMLCSIARRRQL